MRLILDVGNSRVHATVWGEGPARPPVLDRFPVPHDCDPANVAALIERTARALGPRFPVTIGAVHHAGRAWTAALRAEGLRCDLFDRGVDLPLTLDLRSAETAGVDRVSAALAAHRCHGAAVVVDAGTAITVDRVDASGRFEGGAIVPGRAIAAASLARSTDRLPDAGLDEDGTLPEFPGRDTRTAIRSGIGLGLPGLVDRLADLLREGAPTRPVLLITGGDAAWFLRHCRLPFVHDPDLVALGLLLAGDRG